MSSGYTFIVNQCEYNPHVCEWLDAIWAYIVCSLLARLGIASGRFNKHPVIVLLQYRRS